MKRNGVWTKVLVDCTEVECTHHRYAWSGKMPCTGMLKCVLCGKPEDESTHDGSRGGVKCSHLCSANCKIPS